MLVPVVLFRLLLVHYQQDSSSIETAVRDVRAKTEIMLQGKKSKATDLVKALGLILSTNSQLTSLVPYFLAELSHGLPLLLDDIPDPSAAELLPLSSHSTRALRDHIKELQMHEQEGSKRSETKCCKV